MSGPEGMPNDGDRLRRIDRLWRTAQMRAATGAVTQADVLALVEIAEAAERCVARGLIEITPEYADLCRALARLDRPSSDGTADSGAAEEDS